MKNLFILFAAAIIVMASCKPGNTTKQSKITETKVTSNKERILLSNFSLQIPKGWEQEQPNNNMRVAQLSYTSNSDYKIAVFYFGQQDMVTDNIERWKNQFIELESKDELVLSVKAISSVKLLGTFKKKPFPMSQEFIATANYGTLAAIVPSEEGPYYFQISAPKEFILEHEQDFIDLLNSYTNM